MPEASVPVNHGARANLALFPLHTGPPCLSGPDECLSHAFVFAPTPTLGRVSAFFLGLMGQAIQRSLTFAPVFGTPCSSA